MAAVLLDTHVWAWSMIRPELLSERAVAALGSDVVSVSPISFFEIGQKVRIGKWPEMEPIAEGLVDLLREQGGVLAPLTPEICFAAGRADGTHRDPFDRLLAATSRQLDLPLVTRDAVFLAMGVTCIW